jgi:hypothetical protein
MTEVHATRIIPDLDSSRFEEISQDLLKSKNSKMVHEFFDSKLYSTGDDSNGYYFLVSNRSGRVVYFVRYRLVQSNGMKFGRQVLVWRTKNTQGTISVSGLAKKVFNSYLLPRFGRLITDTQQTENGRAFWEFMLNEAFDNNTPVYVLDKRSSPNRLYRSTRESFVKDYDIVYGDSQPFERTHFVISSSEIQEF